MARKARVEFEGAVYHVMSRGDRGQLIYRTDRDREMYMDTLDEACVRYGWRIYAFVLMGNHYHFLLKTPAANLVVGMKWLQGTYTQRFNSRHKEWGHLFQGRYKALLVQSDAAYFSTVATYIHLNPVRAGLMDFDAASLSAFKWSSYPLYLRPERRPSWLAVDRVMGNYQWVDDAAGRDAFRRMMRKRVLECVRSDSPSTIYPEWQAIRRGWCLGDSTFRKQMEERVDQRISSYDRRSYLGESARRRDEVEAVRLFDYGLKVVGLREDDLSSLRKSDDRKKLVAWLIREYCGVRNDWICEKLVMGRASNLSRYVREIRDVEDTERVALREMMIKAF